MFDSRNWQLSSPAVDVEYGPTHQIYLRSKAQHLKVTLRVEPLSH